MLNSINTQNGDSNGEEAADGGVSSISIEGFESVEQSGISVSYAEIAKRLEEDIEDCPA